MQIALRLSGRGRLLFLADCISEPTPHPGGGGALWGAGPGESEFLSGSRGAPVDAKVIYKLRQPSPSW